jgi:ABC-2 type transport system ATP-binding protein
MDHDEREPSMIEVRSLTKRFGPTTAVDDLSFDVLPGRVTGFLGPNGSGKSTTMRMILGLDHPTSGAARVNGRNYGQIRRPLMMSTPDARAFLPILTVAGAAVIDSAEELHVTGLDSARVGELAARNGIVLHELSPRYASLEAAFMELTRYSLDYRTTEPSAAGASQ